MNENIITMAEFSIKPGEVDNFKALVKEMVEATQANEPDMMTYEFFISEDDTSCQIIERYVDSDAVMAHLGHFGSKFGERFMALAEPKWSKVCGNPSGELREVMNDFGAMIFTPVGGFIR